MAPGPEMKFWAPLHQSQMATVGLLERGHQDLAVVPLVPMGHASSDALQLDHGTSSREESRQDGDKSQD